MGHHTKHHRINRKWAKNRRKRKKIVDVWSRNSQLKPKMTSRTLCDAKKCRNLWVRCTVHGWRVTGIESVSDFISSDVCMTEFKTKYFDRSRYLCSKRFNTSLLVQRKSLPCMWVTETVACVWEKCDDRKTIIKLNRNLLQAVKRA